MKEGTKILVRQTRSYIGRTERVRNTLRALGLGRIGNSQELTMNPAVAGMIRKVEHLVSVTPVR